MFSNFVKTIENWYQVKEICGQFANIYFIVINGQTNLYSFMYGL